MVYILSMIMLVDVVWGIMSSTPTTLSRPPILFTYSTSQPIFAPSLFFPALFAFLPIRPTDSIISPLEPLTLVWTTTTSFTPCSAKPMMPDISLARVVPSKECHVLSHYFVILVRS
jgi:hypothetical protein